MANRYFLPSLPAAGHCTVDGDLAHHLGRVLRVQPGDEVVLGDGVGGTAICRVQAVAKQRIELEVLTARYAPPCRPRVVLAFAPPKLQRGEWLFEHGTELGVARFAPIWTERTRPHGERPERWQRIVAAAAGQCDRAWIPELAAAEDLGAFLQRADLPAFRVLADAAGEPLSADAATESVCLLVGPEGGFSAAERQTAIAAGFAPRRFGPHVLRTETAAALGAALLLARGS